MANGLQAFMKIFLLLAMTACFSLNAQTPVPPQTNTTLITNPSVGPTNKLSDEGGTAVPQTLAADVRDYEQHPENWQGGKLISVARGYALETNYEQAIVVFKKLLAVQPDNTNAIRGLGNCYSLIQKNEAAVAQYKQGWALGDDSSLVCLANQYCWYTQQYQELKPLIPDLLKVRERATDPDIKHEITNDLLLYSLNTPLPAGRAVFLKAIDGLSDEFILERKDTAEIVIHGLETFGFQDRASQLGKKRADQEGKEALLLYEAGTTEYRTGNFTGAIADLSKAIELLPTNATFYFKRGNVEHYLGKYNEAAADYSKSIELEPKYWPAYDNRGNVEFLLGNPDGAIADYTKSIELNPASPNSYQGLGFVQNNLGQWQAALENFRKSLQLAPSLSFSRLYIWLIRSRLGEQDEATKELTAYLPSRQLAKANDWLVTIGQFLVGTLAENDFISDAKAKVSTQEGKLCQAYYFIGMKHLLAGDKNMAADSFQKSLDTKAATIGEYHSAEMELNVLKK